jgi:hypothetical protein
MKSINIAAVVATLAIAAFAATAAQAQQVKSVEGGSSAFLGTFAAGKEGALPQLIGTPTVVISGYRNTSGEADTALAATANVVNSGGTVIETDPVEVRYINDSTKSDYGNIIVLIRKDSGNGVRYITNSYYVSGFTGFSHISGDSTHDAAIESYLQNTAGAKAITAGLSDVSADTIYRYASSSFTPALNSPLTTSGAAVLKPTRIGVLTFLSLYHSSSSSQLSFSRIDIRSLINGSTVDGLSKDFHREATSGTRLTELLDIQANYDTSHTPYPWTVITATPYDYLAYVAENSDPLSLETSTGNEIAAVDGANNSFGYAFVTGSAGLSASNTYVGAYAGYDAFNNVAGTSGPIALSSATQFSQSQRPFEGVYQGNYVAWSYENLYENASSLDSVAEAIASVFQDNSAIAHGQGILTRAELENNSVYRDYFVSDITLENVYDGQNVDYSSVDEGSFPGLPQS